MDSFLSIKVADLMQPSIDNNFQDPRQQWVGDFIDEDSNHFEKNMDAYKQQQQGLGDQIQRYVDESHMHATDANPASDPVPMAMNPALINSRDLQDVPTRAASKLASQVNGFNNSQAREDFTFGVVASASSDSLVNARVVAETPNTKIAGTILAVGDKEFAVIWDDKTASVERKSDYELVISK